MVVLVYEVKQNGLKVKKETFEHAAMVKESPYGDAGAVCAQICWPRLLDNILDGSVAIVNLNAWSRRTQACRCPPS